MRRFSLIRHIAAIAGVVISLTAFASAQTVINMPPPPRKIETIAQAPDAPAAPSAPAATGSSTASATGYTAHMSRSQTVDVGDIALARYSRARYGTYDTYQSDSMYPGGIRVYSYPRYFPQFVWGPWWGWGGFGFHKSCW